MNNLLQRDDEGDDPTDDEDPYMHGGKLINNKKAFYFFCLLLTSFSNTQIDDLISLLDINSQHAESVLLEAEGSVFDEESFRLTRRFGGGRLNPNSSSSGNNNPSSSDLGGERGVSGGGGGDSRKSTYRIRDHRWYDSYRDEIFSNSSSSHHHNHHSHHSHQRASNTNSTSSGSSSGHHHNNESRSGDAQATSHHDSRSTKSNLTNAFSFGDKLQFWPDKCASGDKALFSKIASIYSELIAVSKHDGQLHQWKWSSDTPFVSKINLNTSLDTTTTSNTDHSLISLTIFHPKVLCLQLLNERICDVSAATVRASCWTESGKVKWKFYLIYIYELYFSKIDKQTKKKIASWLDESVDIPQMSKFQTPAQSFLNTNNLATSNDAPTDVNDKIVEISTSNLFSVVRTSSGAIYWW